MPQFSAGGGRGEKYIFENMATGGLHVAIWQWRAVEGVSEELISHCDKHVEIPMRGIKQSLNVATAAGIIGYEVLRYYNRNIQ